MTAIFSFLSPIAITDAMLVSSNVPESDYPAWDSTHTYGVGDRCIKAHRIYECQEASNLNKDPIDLTNQFGTVVWWLDVDPTNRWAIFDGEVSTQTTQATSISMVLQPGPFGDLYLAGLEAAQLTVTVKDTPGGTVVYSYTGTLEGSAPADYFEYFFDPFKPLRKKALRKIPAYSNPELTVTLTGGIVKCGVLAVGFFKDVGRPLRGAKAKPKNFGYVDIDKYGKLKAIRGKAATDLSISAVVDHVNTRIAQEAIADVLGTPCAVIASDRVDYEGLSTFGLISAEFSYDSETTDSVSVTVEGLI